MATQIHWAGPETVQCRALAEAGYPLTVEPFDSFELADELAEALLASVGDWQEGPGPGKPAPATELDDLKVAELDALAAELGVADYPAKGKPKKVAAIRAAQAASAAHEPQEEDA